MASRAMWCLLAVALAARSATAVLVACPAGGSRCQNGGTCLLDSEVGTYCSCPVGYEGTLCEVLTGTPRLACGTGLLVNYCINGGLCPTTNSSYCDCTVITEVAGNTYRGAHCEVPAVKCAGVPLWCYNDGVCTPTGTGTTLCQCGPAWGGGRCQNLLGQSPSSTAVFTPAPGTVAVPTWVAAPIIIGVVLLLGFAGCVCFMARRERSGNPVFKELPDSDAPKSPTRGTELARRSQTEEARAAQR